MGFKPQPNDSVIVVIGGTGSGKTNFINAITGNAEKAKASLLASATQKVTPYTIPHHGLRLVLVDTPGFDDSHRSDAEILQLIADWLTTKYPDGETLRLTGIVFLHRMTDNRLTNAAYKNLGIFSSLCGNIPLRRARLVTTMWDVGNARLGRSVLQNREKELIEEFWQPLIAEGAITERFENTPESALRIVDNIIAMEIPRDELLIQEELVEQQKRLNETEAGKVLYSRFQQLLSEQRRTLKELADEARLQNDPILARSLQEEYDQINALLEKTFQEMQAMKIPLTRRIALWLFGRRSRGRAVKLDYPTM